MSLNVIPFPQTYCDTEAQLRALADEVASGEFGASPQIVCVISSEDCFQVRGLGRADSFAAIALLNLGASWVVNDTLEQMED